MQHGKLVQLYRNKNQQITAICINTDKSYDEQDKEANDK